MRSSLTLCLGLSLLAAGALSASTEIGARALVVAVDVKAKSVTLRHTTAEGKPLKEAVAYWDDTTEWARSGKEIWDIKPATADLAKELKKDTKVYVNLLDAGDGKLRLTKLRTIPPGEKVE